MRSRFLFCFLGFFPLLFLCLVQPGYARDAQEKSEHFDRDNSSDLPYKQMLDDPLSFEGFPARTVETSNQKYIPIALFVPKGPNNPAGEAVHQGAELAVSDVNAKGGYNGIPFKLVHRWAGSPWSAGSTEMIKFVYQDKAAAVISFMSASSHIAEQIAVKSYIPVITPVASDPSLTQARVPWIFRLPPDDQVQAEILVRECVAKVGKKGIGLVTATDQDSRMAAVELEKEMIKQGCPPLFHHRINGTQKDFQAFSQRIKADSPTAIVMKIKPLQVGALLSRFRESGIVCPLFIPWVPGLEINTLRRYYYAPVFVLTPFDVFSPSYEAFEKQYYERYQQYHKCSPFCAALAYDAVQLISRAILSKGSDTATLLEELQAMSGYRGVCGTYRWDNSGSNMAYPFVNSDF